MEEGRIDFHDQVSPPVDKVDASNPGFVVTDINLAFEGS